MDLASVTNNQVSSFLASRIRYERQRQGHTQATMAEKAGIALRTYKRIELSGAGSIKNLIVILRVLERIKAIGLLIPAPVDNIRLSIVERINLVAEVAQNRAR